MNTNKIKISICIAITSIGLVLGFLLTSNNPFNSSSKDLQKTLKDSSSNNGIPDPSSINHNCDYGTYCIQKDTGSLYYNGEMSGFKEETAGIYNQIKFYMPTYLWTAVISFVNAGGTLTLSTFAKIQFQVNIFTPCFHGGHSAKDAYDHWMTPYEWYDTTRPDEKETLGNALLGNLTTWLKALKINPYGIDNFWVQYYNGGSPTGEIFFDSGFTPK
ncbi:hypothetical protein [Mycoplasma sp. SG1]|uniref:hypothetical protein n=1 Tax=Mycoplasma sp. SG1 TaxID=2810348 RepID=UPI002024BC37|nr:hypothetical protein [Mycoplasma sp. SG1]URM52941.1 hypothetical protein JRW51_01170 [Mycoplasma sp. SG1]